MNIKRMLLAVAVVVQAMASAQAQWIGAKTGSSSTYTNSGNWTDGIVNDDFTGVTLTGTLTLLMPNFSPATDFKFDYDGEHPMRLQGDGGVRTLTLAAGQDVSFQPNGTGRTFTAGVMLGSTNRLVHFTTTSSTVSPTFTIGAGNTWNQNGQWGGGSTYIKRGAGTLSMNRGTANNFNVDVQEGIFNAAVSGFFPGAGYSITVGSSGTFQYTNGSMSNGLTLRLNGGVVNNFAGWSGVTLISTGGGTLANNGSSFTLGGNVSYVAGGPNNTLTLDGPIALGASRTFTVANGSQAIDVDVTGALSGGVGVTKEGLGVMRLGGANAYTGATAVNAGILEVAGDGSINTSSGVTVAAGSSLLYNSSVALTKALTLNGSGGIPAVLSGSGTINAAVTLNSLDDVLSPGNSPGVLSFGTDQTWESYTYAWEVNDWTGTTAGTDFDQIVITGSLTLSGSSYAIDLLSLTSANVPGNVPNFSETNQSWKILTTTGGITGFHASEWLVNPAGFTNTHTGSWSVLQVGNDLDLVFTVPEPSAVVLGGVGIVVAGWVVRRKWRGICRR